MKNIGKYNGIPCYTCTDSEWYECYRNGNDNGKQIFIIDGVMVRNNKIIGHYDGTHVKDRYDEQPYFIDIKIDNRDEKKLTFTVENKTFVEEVKAAQEGRTEAETAVAVSYEELVKQDINFGNYSTVVDEFFALLEV